jgi:hypothetical protein
MSNSGTQVCTDWFTISYELRTLEADWRAATSETGSDGRLTFRIDGVQQAALTGVNNYGRRIEKIRLGLPGGSLNGVSGTVYIDGFESYRGAGVQPTNTPTPTYTPTSKTIPRCYLCPRRKPRWSAATAHRCGSYSDIIRICLPLPHRQLSLSYV